MKLTDLTIRRASVDAKAYTLSDGAGLYLNIKSNGTKQWLYRFYWEGIQKRISLGLYPTVDLKKARSLRQQAQDMLSQGIDPRTGRKSSSKTNYIQEKNEMAPVMTFAQYADIWKAFKFKKLGLDHRHRRQSTHTQIERYLRKDILPLLSKKRLDEIRRSDVLNV